MDSRKTWAIIHRILPSADVVRTSSIASGTHFAEPGGHAWELKAWKCIRFDISLAHCEE